MPLPQGGEDYKLVTKTALLSGLPADVLEGLLTDTSVQTVDSGEVLFIQGEPAKACYVVLEGWVKVYRLTPGGEEAVVAVFARGQSFAEAPVFTNDDYPVNAEAVTPVRLLRIPSHALLQRIHNNPEIALSMLASTSRHLRQLVRQIEQLKTYSSAQRVARFLTSLCPVEEGACTIGLPYDKALIAGRLGMKPESLSRAFARLRGIGVRIERGAAAISDIERLKNYASPTGRQDGISTQ